MPPERARPLALPPMRIDDARRLLAPPWMPALLAAALGRACRARPLAVPVRLVLPLPALGPRVARALHTATGPGGDLLLATAPCVDLRALPRGATVVVEPAALDAEGIAQLEAALDDGESWILALSGRDDDLPPALAMRLEAVRVDVPPLARRQLELPALSAAILHTLAQRAGRDTPSVSAAARRALANHPWPGDVLELEAVLGRALAGTDGPTIELPHLDLDGADASEPTPAPAAEPPPATVTGPAAGPVSPPSPPPNARLEMLLAELSHEFLNPLSTVKMFVGHLPQLQDDEETRRRLAERAGEAIDRVDGLLRNVLEFARLGTPHRQAVELGALLDRLLAEAASELAERSVRVRRTGETGVRCLADPAQLEYGLRNLLTGVLRELPARDEFTVDASRNGVVGVRFAAGDVAASRLRALIAPEGERRLGDPTMLPLPFSLARAVIERNGGSLAVHEEADGPTTLVVRLPTAATA